MALQTLVTFASWEDRFRLGVKGLIDRGGIGEVLMIHSFEYRVWTAENRDLVAGYANAAGIHISSIEISLPDVKESWKSINSNVSGIFNDVVIDVSTMPREIIVFSIDALRSKNKNIKYYYALPEKYSPNWLSRDPAKPRIILGRGGVSYFDRSNLLCVSIGYDIERVLHLVNFYEPSKLVAFFQNEEDMDCRGDLISRSCGVSVDCNIVDFIEGDRGVSAAKEALSKYRDSHNIMLASLGPKISAITFYEISCFWPDVCLVYAPSNEYNREYSAGIGKILSGDVRISEF